MKNARPRGATHSLRAIGSLLGQPLAPALRNRGLGGADIIGKWREIVSPQIAQETKPEKLTFPSGKRSGGTLRICAPASFAVQLQHMEPILLDRINSFFGYNAIARISIVHERGQQSPPRTPGKSPKSLDRQTQAEIESITQCIKDPELREAIQSLGKSVKSQRFSSK